MTHHLDTPEKVELLLCEQAQQNTDRELWRTTEGDYYSKHNLFVTKDGAIGLGENGHFIVMPPEKWFELASTRHPIPQSKGDAQARELLEKIKDYAETKKLYSDTDEGADMAFEILEIIKSLPTPPVASERDEVIEEALRAAHYDFNARFCVRRSMDKICWELVECKEQDIVDEPINVWKFAEQYQANDMFNKKLWEHVAKVALKRGIKMQIELEQEIDRVGRDKVFARAQELGWKPSDAPPSFVWWGICSELSNPTPEPKDRA